MRITLKNLFNGCLLLFVFVQLTSCSLTIEKRRYRPGYHVNMIKPVISHPTVNDGTVNATDIPNGFSAPDERDEHTVSTSIPTPVEIKSESVLLPAITITTGTSSLTEKNKSWERDKRMPGYFKTKIKKRDHRPEVKGQHATKVSSGIAIGALILGILALILAILFVVFLYLIAVLLSYVPYIIMAILAGITGVAAVLMGIIGLQSDKRKAALIGIILGSLGLAILLTFLLLVFAI